MTMEEVNHPILKSAFLDSLGLVSLFKLWDVCSSANISLDQTLDWEKPRWERLKDSLNSAGVGVNVLKRPEDVNRGFNIYATLRPASSDFCFFTSHVCWAEMHHVLLEQIGLESLVQRGIPLSLREKRPQLLYRDSLARQDYEQIDDGIDEFRESLKLDCGIDVIEVEDTSTGLDIKAIDIWNGARAIWSSFLMTAVDAYVCAAAISIEADVFMTGETSRRDILNSLREPNSGWDRVAEAVRTACRLDTEANFPLPVMPGSALV